MPVNVVATPEPGSLVLLGGGVVAFGLLRRKPAA
jgi:PEP-CTERM motif